MSLAWLKSAILGITVTVGAASGVSEPADYVVCEVHPLEDYGFVQWGELPEYVCVIEGDTYIIEDEFDEFRLGDILGLDTNVHGEILDYEVLIMTEERYNVCEQ